MIKKVLIPNRGEIAVRIIKAAHLLGIRTVLTLSELEKDTLPAKLSDEIHLFKNEPLQDNYLNVELIIRLAQKYNADSIHPGYGFLSENYRLAKACSQAGITLIGPSADNLMLMGDKQMARTIAQKAYVPLTQSWKGAVPDILSEADGMPYPVVVKAALGGGGKGMRICNNRDELGEHLPRLSRQAKRYFGDERLYVEQYLQHARHIEVQILADKHGNTVHLFERECSVQRRFQKLIEEAPAVNLDGKIKQALYTDALKLCRAINYTNAGTIEFLIDHTGKHYFLEMNTRIQVEHCVTEEITGIDLVQWQFKLADSEQLTFGQEDVKASGHAIELRICAEDPANNFQPSPGKITTLLLPDHSDARIEIGIDRVASVHRQFDPMLAKLIVHAPTRRQAIDKALHYNRQLIVRGIKTNGLYLSTILAHAAFTGGQVHTRFCEENHKALLRVFEEHQKTSALAYAVFRWEKIKNILWRQLPLLSFSIGNIHYKCKFNFDAEELSILLNNEDYTISSIELKDDSLSFSTDNQHLQFYCYPDREKFELIHQLRSTQITAHDRLPAYRTDKTQEPENRDKHLKAPIPAQVIKVNVGDGQKVKKGDLLLILEAMKTENHIKALKDGVIEKVVVKTGEQVKLKQLLITYQD